MEETKIIVFEYAESRGNYRTEEVEFDIDTPEEVIKEAFEDWVWEIIGDKVTWYEK